MGKKRQAVSLSHTQFLFNNGWNGNKKGRGSSWREDAWKNPNLPRENAGLTSAHPVSTCSKEDGWCAVRWWGCRRVALRHLNKLSCPEVKFLQQYAFLFIVGKACFSSASSDESILWVNTAFLSIHCLSFTSPSVFHSVTSQNVGLCRSLLQELTHSALFSLHDNWCYFFTCSCQVWAQAF